MEAPYKDRQFIDAYLRYQERYRTQIRESDKIILQLLHGSRGTLLDAGCSSGNLLRAIRDTHPQFALIGGDISEESVRQCRADTSLAGIRFLISDVFTLEERAYDVIIANAVLYCLADFDGAIASISHALRPGGKFIAFDFFHPFEQEVAIVETTPATPGGHPLFMRSMQWASEVFRRHGLEPDFHPFAIPIRLEGSGIKTRTVDSEVGRLQFRGAIYQPWCHLVARALS